MSNLMNKEYTPEEKQRIRHKKFFNFKAGGKNTWLVWGIIIGLIILIMSATGRCEENEWPTAINKYKCKDGLRTTWMVGGCANVYITIDCKGNIWWLKTSGKKATSSVVEEQILYTGESLAKALKVWTDTVKQHDIPAKEIRWWEK